MQFVQSLALLCKLLTYFLQLNLIFFSFNLQFINIRCFTSYFLLLLPYLLIVSFPFFFKLSNYSFFFLYLACLINDKFVFEADICYEIFNDFFIFY